MVQVPENWKARDESARRKQQPITRGCLRYFPDALLAVAELSLYGNEKHNPGEELHWSKGKSNDHADCAVRHLLEKHGIDTSYGPGKHVLHSVAAAWRALANAQTEIEELRAQGKWPLNVEPIAPAAPSGDWIPWSGETIWPPLNGNTNVEVRLRDGQETCKSPVKAWRWSHSVPKRSSDIVAYRVVS